MYTKESLNKAIQLMKAEKAFLESKNASDIAMCISNGNKKIGKVMNVSLPPILTCHNCKECKYFCYDIKACLQYPNTVINARIRNLVILQHDINDYFNRIREKISRRRTNKFFRWHVSGDIINNEYFSNMVSIAREFPDFTFWTYTKNYPIVNHFVEVNGGDREKAIPSNFHIMFSEWDGMPLVNPYNFPIFTCKLKAGNKNHQPEFFNSLYECPGNCDLCKACKRGCIGGENTYCNEH